MTPSVIFLLAVITGHEFDVPLFFNHNRLLYVFVNRMVLITELEDDLIQQHFLENLFAVVVFHTPGMDNHIMGR